MPHQVVLELEKRHLAEIQELHESREVDYVCEQDEVLSLQKLFLFGDVKQTFES